MGNCCNKVTETTCDHSDYETQPTRHELVLTNEGQTPLIITLRNESLVSSDCNSFGCPGAEFSS